MNVQNKTNLADSSLHALKQWFVERGYPDFRATQIKHWVHQKKVTCFAEMSNLGQKLRTELEEAACIQFPQVVYEKISSDGTCKWLLNLKDSNKIETVYIPQGDRGTLCISSQVGCTLNCSFCSTGKEGFNRNLDLSEVIGQLWLAAQRFKITNVVMMGMGEPLLNYPIVLEAMRLMLDDMAYGLSQYRATLSTAGVVPAMLQLKQDIPVALAVSLHAPNNVLRNELVPLNKKYSLETLIPVCRDYFSGKSKRRVTFEYVMLRGVNDTDKELHELIQLLQGVPCKINLIPFNPFPKTHYETSLPEVIEAFQMKLMQAGFDTRVRRTRGDEIDAACGQLAGDIQDRTGRHQRWQRTGKLVV